MPNMNGTGPEGEGPKTGRMLGNCEGARKILNPTSKRGLGRRRISLRRRN